MFLSLSDVLTAFNVPICFSDLEVGQQSRNTAPSLAGGGGGRGSEGAAASLLSLRCRLCAFRPLEFTSLVSSSPKVSVTLRLSSLRRLRGCCSDLFQNGSRQPGLGADMGMWPPSSTLVLRKGLSACDFFLMCPASALSGQ